RPVPVGPVPVHEVRAGGGDDGGCDVRLEPALGQPGDQQCVEHPVVDDDVDDPDCAELRELAGELVPASPQGRLSQPLGNKTHLPTLRDKVKLRCAYRLVGQIALTLRPPGPAASVRHARRRPAGACGDDGARKTNLRYDQNRKIVPSTMPTPREEMLSASWVW